MEDGRGEGAVGAEGHAVVVELRARVEFVDARLDGGFPYLQADLNREVEEFVEGLRGAFEGLEEDLARLGEGEGVVSWGGVRWNGR